jgi:hypothetical protein
LNAKSLLTVFLAALVLGAGFGLGRAGNVNAQPTAPINLFAAPISDSEILFAWHPGAENTWTCINLAESYEDLARAGPTWHNRGCGNTDSMITIGELACGTTYYWNVYAWSNTGSATSQWSIIKTAECGTQSGLALIDEAEVFARDGRLFVRIEAGLLDDCIMPGTHDFYLASNRVVLWVWTFVEPGDACIADYDTYELEVDIGAVRDYAPGQAYTVSVNDEVSVAFTAS